MNFIHIRKENIKNMDSSYMVNNSEFQIIFDNSQKGATLFKL